MSDVVERPHRRFVRILLWAAFGLGGTPFVLLSLWLVFLSETFQARVLAFLILAALAVPAACLHGFFSPPRIWKRFVPALVAAGAAASLSLWLALLIPSGEPMPGSPASSLFLGGKYRRFALSNILPEIDQFKLFTTVSPLFHPRVDRELSKKILALSLPVMREMKRSPEFESLASARGEAYADLMGRSYEAGHLYEYVPPHHAGERLPALIFVHGFGGNWKAFLWMWRPFADRHRFIILCPSFGAGIWYRSGGVEAIMNAVQHGLETLDADPDRIYLAGLSNGGFGVTEAAAHFPRSFAGIAYISAVVEEGRVTSPSFMREWQGRPVLFIHGDRDQILRNEAVVQRTAGGIAENGVRATLRMYPGEDHFLFFSSTERVFADIAAWIEGMKAK